MSWLDKIFKTSASILVKNHLGVEQAPRGTWRLLGGLSADDSLSADELYLRAPLATTINVCDAPYNADPTGATEASAAINAAIAAASDAGSGTVHLPDGVFRITAAEFSAIRARSNVHLKGNGIGATTLKVEDSGPTYRALFDQDPGTTLSSFIVSDMTIDQNVSGNTDKVPTLTNCFFVAEFTKFNDVRFIGCHFAGGFGVNTLLLNGGDVSEDALVINCTFEVDPQTYYDNSTVYFRCKDAICVANRFKATFTLPGTDYPGAACETHYGPAEFNDNEVIGYDVALNAVCEFNQDDEPTANVLVACDNDILDCSNGVVIWTMYLGKTVRGVLISGNNMMLNQPKFQVGDFGGVCLWPIYPDGPSGDFENIEISNNLIAFTEDPTGTLATAHCAGLYLHPITWSVTGTITGTGMKAITVSTGTGEEIKYCTSAAFYVGGSWTGTIDFEQSSNGTDWTSLSATPVGGGAASATSCTANGSWVASLSSAKQIRLRGASVTGTANVYLQCQPSTVKNLVVKDNTIVRAPSRGIDISGTLVNAHISDNDFIDCGCLTTVPSPGDRSIFYAYDPHGIETSWKNVVIEGNRIFDSTDTTTAIGSIRYYLYPNADSTGIEVYDNPVSIKRGASLSDWANDTIWSCVPERTFTLQTTDDTAGLHLTEHPLLDENASFTVHANVIAAKDDSSVVYQTDFVGLLKREVGSDLDLIDSSFSTALKTLGCPWLTGAAVVDNKLCITVKGQAATTVNWRATIKVEKNLG